MTKDEMAQVMVDMVEQEKGLREAGQREYANDEENAFANFERAAERLGITREEVLVVFLLKHIDGIISFVKKRSPQREPIGQRIGDARVYLALLAGMLKEYEGKMEARAEERHEARMRGE